LGACVLGLASASTAAACSWQDPRSRIVAPIDLASFTFAEGTDILIELYCPRQGCLNLPTVELRDAEGVLVGGALAFIEEPTRGVGGEFRPRYVRFHPDAPLEAGDYVLHLMLDKRIVWEDEISSFELELSVRGEPLQAASDVEVSVELKRDPEGVPKRQFVCDVDSCGPYPTPTHYLEIPELELTLSHRAGAEASELLYRAVQILPDETRRAEPWLALDYRATGALRRVTFDEAQTEYCVAIEALRVRDQEVLTVHERCVPHTLGELRSRPVRYFSCDGACEAAACATSVEMFRQAWCEDNAASCHAAAASFGLAASSSCASSSSVRAPRWFSQARCPSGRVRSKEPST
jgi:hypothetical protein